jgi:O-antigen ligase
MDSLKVRWREWGMFQGGRLPLGHMHSSPLQIALERGIPALVCWLWWFARYLQMLRRGVRSEAVRRDPTIAGIYLGTLGGTLGFLASSLVHYNFGDSEAIMIVYFQMGLIEGFHRLEREGAEG